LLDEKYFVRLVFYFQAHVSKSVQLVLTKIFIYIQKSQKEAFETQMAKKPAFWLKIEQSYIQNSH